MANFLSIGEEPVWINLEKKVNVLIGANNSGKSNVMKSLLWFREALDKGNYSMPATHRHRTNPKTLARLFLRVRQDEQTPEIEGAPSVLECELELLEKQFVFRRGFFEDVKLAAYKHWAQRQGTSPLPTHATEDQVRQEKHKSTLQLAQQLLETDLPEIRLVPQFRQIRAGTQYAIDGIGIVELLASWQHPVVGSDEDRKGFEQVRELLRGLLHAPNLDLEIPLGREHIIVS
ncbi:unnamed protein product, partial [marine sediment metagenome]